jgi:hypothetical protein
LLCRANRCKIRAHGGQLALQGDGFRRAEEHASCETRLNDQTSLTLAMRAGRL